MNETATLLKHADDLKQIAASLASIASKVAVARAKVSVRALAIAIARMEGADDPRSVNQRLIREHKRWNQGHLVWAGQRNATGIYVGDRTWAAWPSEEEGWQGLMRQIRLDAGRGHSLKTFVEKFAPRFENRTDLYVKSVSEWSGIPATAQLSDVLDFSDVA